MRKLKLTLLVIGLILCILSSNFVNASYDNADLNWETYKPSFQGAIFVENPQTSAPYAPGKLSEGFLLDGLNLMNYYRFLSGVPSDIEMDMSLNEQAQYGATLLAAINNLTHNPYKPQDMDNDFYTLALKSINSSNLCYGLNSLAESVKMYMSDSDVRNIDRLGHRRWILNPQMKKTGFGYVNNYSVVQVFDKSRLEQFDYEYIAWPNNGLFPSEFFNNGDAWSISLNPEKYDNQRILDIRVKLINIIDGREWSFDFNDTDKTGKYFNVDTNRYGIPFCIIFKPNEIYEYSKGDKYKVEISGVYDKLGQKVDLEYSVEFFNMTNKMEFCIGSPIMNVNGIKEEIDPGRGTEPVIINDRALLPIRKVVEIIGGNIEWITNENAAVIKLYDKEIKLWVGSKNVLVNGTIQFTDVEPIILNERTMVPLRVVMENLGCEVEWNGTLKQISVFY